jgi:hypothetical protein
MTIQDPVFGELEYDNGWQGAAFVPFLNTHFELTLNSDLHHPPGEEERSTWQTFLARQEQLKTTVTTALFDYYNRHLEDLRMPFDTDEEAEFAPTLTEPEAIWTLLKPTKWLWIELGHDNEHSAISIEFNPRWDEEHGLSLTFYNDQIGISEGGAHWVNNDHYDLNGRLVQVAR